MVELKELVCQARSGDLDAYDQIVRRFQDMAVGYGYSLLDDFHLAEDAAQEAFIAAYQRLPQLRNAAAFPGWFRRIVFKHCDRLTRGRQLTTIPLETSMPAPGANPAAATELKELQRRIEEAIRRLPERERQVTALYYIAEYSQREISEFLGIPLTTIRSRLHTARGLLRDRMMDMVREQLRDRRPSRDDRLANKVQLFNAVNQSDLDTVKSLLQKKKELLGARDGVGHTPLHRAALRGQNEIVALLLKKGAEVDARCDTDLSAEAPLRCSDQGEKGETPLHVVARNTADCEIVSLLLEKGADIEAQNARGMTPLRLAAWCGFPLEEPGAPFEDMATFLLKKGAVLDIFTAAGLRHHGDRGVALLKQDPQSAQERNDRGETPLHWAAWIGHKTMAWALVKHGAELDAQDHQGITPLYRAAQPGTWRWHQSTQVKDMLIKSGAEVDLFVASILGLTERAEELLEADPTLIDARGPEDVTPLCLAAWNGRRSVVELLLRKGARIDATDCHGRTAVSIRYELNDYHREIAHLLLERGAEPDIFAAVALERADKVEELLAHHTRLIEETDPQWSFTSLEWAAFLCADRPTAEVLIRHGAVLDACSAAALGFDAELQHMLEEDPERVHSTNPWDYTPLHWAAERGYLPTAQLLLDSGADMAATCGIGATPLHRAIQDFTRGRNGDNLEMVELLIERGTNVNAKDYYGNTPLRWAKRSGDDEIVSLLKRHGGIL
ncbi:MAG: sigma-70 family RNA polymerase sigma factor [Gemmatimonadetes bacterium]|jgi:RNA polymerase sigma factor (sigma-70 family)|nr:sigma-70 family RNA polymerase sigma factor [Gemmatimonadota bacterium]